MDYTQLKGHTTIAPLMSNFVFDKPGFGVWYKSTPDSLCVNWRCRFESDTASVLDFSANIYKNGDIKFAYDTIKYVTFNAWGRGISKGNGVDVTKFGTDNIIEANKDYLFKKTATDTSVNINSNGIVTLFPDANFTNKIINVTVLDNNDLEGTGSIKLSSIEGSDLKLTSYLLNNDNHQWFAHKDTIRVSITIKNTGNTIKRHVQLSLNSTAHYLDKIKTSIIIPEIASNSEITIPSAFVIKSNPLLESELIDQVNITTAENESIGVLKIKLTPQFRLQIGEFMVDSLNVNIINPHSLHTIYIPITNKNRYSVYHIRSLLNSSSSEAILQNESFVLDSLAGFSSGNLKFFLNTYNFDAPNLVVNFKGEVSCDSADYLYFIKSYGYNCNQMENYENIQHPFIINSVSSDSIQTQIFNDGFNSDKSWLISRPAGTTTIYKFSRSFTVFSNVNSYIEFDYFSKVKSLISQVRLKVVIDEIDQNILNNTEWGHVRIPISEGRHSIRLSFSNLIGTDSIFIDNLSIPNPNDFSQNIYSISPSEVRLKCRPDTIVEFTLEPTGFGTPITTLDYQIVPSAYQKCDWLSRNGVVVLAENQTQPLTYNANTSGLAAGNYTSYIRFYDQHFYTPIKVSLEVVDGYQPPSDGSILVYPNPASDKITFDFISTDEASAELTIYDLMGRKAFYHKQAINFGTDLKFVTYDISIISIANSTKGFYIYRLKVGKDTYQGKITITQ